MNMVFPLVLHTYRLPLLQGCMEPALHAFYAFGFLPCGFCTCDSVCMPSLTWIVTMNMIRMPTFVYRRPVPHDLALHAQHVDFSVGWFGWMVCWFLVYYLPFYLIFIPIPSIYSSLCWFGASYVGSVLASVVILTWFSNARILGLWLWFTTLPYPMAFTPFNLSESSACLVLCVFVLPAPFLHAVCVIHAVVPLSVLLVAAFSY